MERPPKKYVCNKCGYIGISDTHPGCQYLAYLRANPEQLYIDHLEAELAALRASPASAPEGWKLVPVDVTDAMLEAWKRELCVPVGSSPEARARRAYRAMLAAAPTQPSTEDKDKIIAAANALENIASTSSSTRIRRVANEALTAIRARRN